MGFISRMQKDWVTRWTPSTTRDVWNKPSAWTRSYIKGRWEETTERFTDKSGKDSVSRAQVFLSSDILVGDYLYQGRSTASDPTQVQGAQAVRDFKKTPSVTGRSQDERERRALL